MVDHETLADEINRLAQLHADGVLSEKEFTAAKARLLSERPQEEMRLPTSRQVMRLGIGVAVRSFFLFYVVLPLALFVLILVVLWFVNRFG